MLPSTTQTVSAPEITFLSRLNGWPARSPADASPTSSRMPAHGLGPMWVATPSSQWTCTTCSLPVSRRTCVKTPRFGSPTGATRGRFCMGRFVEGESRRERLLLPDCMDDYVGEDTWVGVLDAFNNEWDLPTLGFAGPAATGRPAYSPATMLKLYLYGYLNQVQSSRRLEREAGRNVECLWLTGKLVPDFK